MVKIITLGKNCEISFQIQRYVENFYSGLFSWAGINDENIFIDALQNINDIFTDNIKFHLPSADMFMDTKYKICFHGRTKKSEFLDEDGNITNIEIYNKNLDELKSRVNHLKEKFISDLQSKDKKVYLKTIHDYESFEKVYNSKGKEIYDRFCSKENNSKLFLIVLNQYYERAMKMIENKPDIEILTVNFFAPFNETKDGGDNESWKKIMMKVLEQ